jgi:hypothetical protein
MYELQAGIEQAFGVFPQSPELSSLSHSTWL